MSSSPSAKLPYPPEPSHFIPCGTWEAVYIIEGLLKNKSDVQPQIIHADTQGQSTPVFALSYLYMRSLRVVSRRSQRRFGRAIGVRC
jgi:hypothetical protein